MGWGAVGRGVGGDEEEEENDKVEREKEGKADHQLGGPPGTEEGFWCGRRPLGGTPALVRQHAV